MSKAFRVQVGDNLTASYIGDKMYILPIDKLESPGELWGDLSAEIPASWDVRAICFPEELECIPAEAFKDFQDLTEVVLPDSLIEIGDSAFEGCINLSDVDFPDNLAIIGDRAFKGTSLEEVTLPNSIETIGRGAFADCEIAYANIESGKIGEFAFAVNRYLSDVTLGDDVTVVEEGAFASTAITGRFLANNAAIDSAAFGAQSVVVVTDREDIAAALKNAGIQTDKPNLDEQIKLVQNKNEPTPIPTENNNREDISL